MDKIYSYHTYIYPFLWNVDGNITQEKFEKRCIDNADCWEPDVFDTDDRRNYTVYQYFNSAARRAMFTLKDDTKPVVKNYRYRLGKDARYIIRKRDDGKENEWNLVLDSVRLRIYYTGIAMLVFEVENHNEKQNTPKDIKSINEYGRRIYQPHIDKNSNPKDNSCTECADTVTIEADTFTVTGQINGINQTDCIARINDTLMHFLPWATIDRKKSKEDNLILIEPIIDDRMYTACFYDTKDMVSRMGEWDSDMNNYAYLADAYKKAPDASNSIAKEWYEMLFIDAGGTSCLNRNMLHDLLETCTYDRWIDYNTVAGITEYSMLTLSQNPPPYIVMPFLEEYVEMATLALAQRASLLAFEKRISECASKNSDIGDLYSDYIKFKSHLLLKEVSPQQQGIEMYNKIMDNMFIKNMEESIESQLKNLDEYVENENDKKQNIILAVISILGLADFVNIILNEMLFATKPHIFSFAIFAVLAFIVILIFINIGKYNHKK